MAISESNTRILITIQKKQKDELVKLAKEENRSLSNLCAKIFNDYIKKERGE